MSPLYSHLLTWSVVCASGGLGTALFWLALREADRRGWTFFEEE